SANFSASYWNLISQLNQQVPSFLPVCLFTPNTLGHFTGSKPSVALNLRWRTYTIADSVKTWVQKAWLTSSHNIRVVQGNSKPSATWYTYHTIMADGRSSP